MVHSVSVCGAQCECVWCITPFICMHIVSARLTYIVLRTYVHLSLSHTHTHARTHARGCCTHMLQAASFVSEYLVEQLLFEEALDLCAEDQAATPLTREAISGHIVDGETVA